MIHDVIASKHLEVSDAVRFSPPIAFVDPLNLISKDVCTVQPKFVMLLIVFCVQPMQV